jgi:hypothetical protein
MRDETQPAEIPTRKREADEGQEGKLPNKKLRHPEPLLGDEIAGGKTSP